MIQPPSVGPRIGAATIPKPQNAIAFPRSWSGYSSSRTAWESGWSPPPVVPCSTRNTINAGRFGARPHRTLDSVKPVTTVISRRLRPR